MRHAKKITAILAVAAMVGATGAMAFAAQGSVKRETVPVASLAPAEKILGEPMDAMLIEAKTVIAEAEAAVVPQAEVIATPVPAEAAVVDTTVQNNWVDNDGDGICDNGGTGGNWVDNDGDGVCDNGGTGGNWVDNDGDGTCDNWGTGNGGGNGNGQGNGGNGHRNGGGRGNGGQCGGRW